MEKGSHCPPPPPPPPVFQIELTPLSPPFSPSSSLSKDATAAAAVAATDTPDGVTPLDHSDKVPPLGQVAPSEVLQSPARGGVQPGQGGKEGEEGEVQILRDALRSAEDQVQLIHSEYRNICREKDDMIRNLKAALEQGAEHQEGEVH